MLLTSLHGLSSLCATETVVEGHRESGFSQHSAEQVVLRKHQSLKIRTAFQEHILQDKNRCKQSYPSVTLLQYSTAFPSPFSHPQPKGRPAGILRCIRPFADLFEFAFLRPQGSSKNEIISRKATITFSNCCFTDVLGSLVEGPDFCGRERTVAGGHVQPQSRKAGR